jgi:hypothetical protein
MYGRVGKYGGSTIISRVSTVIGARLDGEGAFLAKQHIMKKNLFLLPICLVLVVAFTAGRRTVVGHWNVAYANKITGKFVCEANGHFEATFTGQTWKVGGQYKLDGETMSFTDSTCGFGYWCKYKMHWYTDDSVQVTALLDSCSGRRLNADGAILVRAKN